MIAFTHGVMSPTATLLIKIMMKLTATKLANKVCKCYYIVPFYSYIRKDFGHFKVHFLYGNICKQEGISSALQEIKEKTLKSNNPLSFA